MSEFLLDEKNININITEQDFIDLEKSPTFIINKDVNHQKVFYIKTGNFSKHEKIQDELLLINNLVPYDLYINMVLFFKEFSLKNNVDFINYEYEFRIQADYVKHNKYFMPAEMHCDICNYTVALPLTETGSVDRYSILLGKRNEKLPQKSNGPFLPEEFPVMEEFKYKKNNAIIFKNRDKNIVKNYHQASLCKALKKGIVRQQAILFCKNKSTTIFDSENNYHFDPLKPNDTVIINNKQHYWVYDDKKI